MVLLEQDGAEALLSQDVLKWRMQRHVWDERERYGLVSTMTAANVGAPSRPLCPRTRAGTARATPPLNAIHQSSDVHVVLTRVDSPPAGLNTCNVDMVPARSALCEKCQLQDYAHVASILRGSLQPIIVCADSKRAKLGLCSLHQHLYINPSCCCLSQLARDDSCNEDPRLQEIG